MNTLKRNENVYKLKAEECSCRFWSNLPNFPQFYNSCYRIKNMIHNNIHNRISNFVLFLILIGINDPVTEAD